MKDKNFLEGNISEETKVIPLEFKVVIEAEVIEDRSAGGIYWPETAREKQQFAIDRGRISSMANNAFADDSIFGDRRPRIGDKVMYSKFAGAIYHTGKGRDRRMFRIMNDKDIFAILEPIKKEEEK